MLCVPDNLRCNRVVKNENKYSVRVKNNPCKKAIGKPAASAPPSFTTLASTLSRKAFSGLFALVALGLSLWLALRSSKPHPKSHAWSCCWDSQAWAVIAAIALNNVLTAMAVSSSPSLHNASAYEQNSNKYRCSACSNASTVYFLYGIRKSYKQAKLVLHCLHLNL